MGVPGAPSRRAARSRREPRHPWVPKAAARRYDHMVPPSEFEVSHSLSPSSATAASLLSCLHSAPGLSAPATMPPGLLPAGTAAWPPALSSAARAARSPAAKRSLPTGPSDLQPAGGAGPPPPTEPQPPALPQQLVPSATGDAGRSLKRKIVPVTGGDPGVRCGPPPCRRLWDPRMSRLTPGPRRSPGRRSGDPHSSKNSWGSTLGHFTYRDPHLGQLSPGTPGCRAGTPRWYSTMHRGSLLISRTVSQPAFPQRVTCMDTC